jgi:hypothetical protein
MPSNENKGPLEKLTDKIRSLMGQQDPQNIKGALPPKTQVSIWYVMAAVFIFTYLQQYYFSAKAEAVSVHTEKVIYDHWLDMTLFMWLSMAGI